MDTLYIVIPAYNEEANIEKVIDDWYPVVEAHSGGGASRLIIVDDGSRDRTFEMMKKCAETRPLFTPLHKENRGHGAAVLYAYRYALEHGADYIFQTDSDGQTLPSEFEPFWELRNENDMVIGWRKGRQDGFARIIVTKTLKTVIRICFGVSVTDANTPFRLIKRNTLEECLKLIPNDFNLSNVVVSVICAQKGYKVKYIPITFRPRQGGVNSINLRKITKIGLKAFSDFIQINKTFKEK